MPFWGNPSTAYSSSRNLLTKEGAICFAANVGAEPTGTTDPGKFVLYRYGGDLKIWDGSNRTTLMQTGGGINAPSESSAPSSPVVGDIYYDTTLNKLRGYQDSGWTAFDGTAAGSLDAAYDGGQNITVDGTNPVDFQDAQTDTSTTFLITKSGAVTSSNSASVMHINSTGVHDTSGTLKMLEISVGSESVTGTILGLEVTMNEDSDAGIKVTKGGLTLTDGDFTASALGRSATSGWTATTANTSGDGFTFNIDSLTSGDGFIIDGDATSGVVYFAIQEGGTSFFTITDDDVYSGKPVEIDVDDADAFLVTEAGDAEVFSIDTTNDAGDTTFSLTSTTTSGKGMNLTVSTTTGVGLEINADAVVGGDALLISIASGTMSTSGSAISVIDSSNSDREIFAVRDTGEVYVYGVGEGTTAQEIGLGDLVITDGDLTLSGGEVAVTDGVTTSGSGILLTSSMTTAGAGAGAAGAITIIADSATTGTVLAIRADGLTSGDMLYLDTSESGMLDSGFFINCNDSNTSKFTVSRYGATVIAGISAGTAALTLSLGDLVITDTDQTTITSVNGTGSIVEIISGGAIGAAKAVLEIDAAGTLNATGSLLRLSADGVTASSTPYCMQIDANGIDMAAINIDSDAATDSVVLINCGGALANNKALIELVWDGTPNNAGTNMLRLDASGGTNTVKPVLLEIYDNGVSVGMTIETASIEDMVVLTGTGVTGVGRAVLAVTSSATIADGGFYVDITSGSNTAGGSGAYLLHLDATHNNIEAIHVDSGDVKFDENFTVTGTTTQTGIATFATGLTQTAVALTATAAGTAIVTGTSMVDVTGGTNANCWLTLPTPVVGHVIWLVGTSGTNFEVRTNQPATVAINGATDTNGESAVGSGITCRLICTSSTTWVGTKYAANGTESAMEIAADA